MGQWQLDLAACLWEIWALVVVSEGLEKEDGGMGGMAMDLGVPFLYPMTLLSLPSAPLSCSPWGWRRGLEEATVL